MNKQKQRLKPNQLGQLLQEGKYREYLQYLIRRVKWLFNNSNKNAQVIGEAEV